MSSKSRNIPISEYLEELQLEYFTNELKSKIYTKRKDREFYKRVAGHKRLKIEDICKRNSLPSIFTDGQVNSDIRKRVYLEVGPPSFLKDEELSMYYRIGEPVKIVLEDKVSIGVVKGNLNSNVISVQVKGENSQFFAPIKRVTRIF